MKRKRRSRLWLDKHARNVHDGSINERRIIATYGNVAILDNGDCREEWVATTPDDPRKGVLIDGTPARFVKHLPTTFQNLQQSYELASICSKATVR